MSANKEQFNRRQVIKVLSALSLSGLPLLTACAEDVSDRYNTGFVAGSGTSTEIPPESRTEAKDFTATTYEGEEFSLSAQLGNPVVLNVWYAACAPCRVEAADLKEIAEEYAPSEVTFIGVNVRDEVGPAKAFEETYEIPYPSIPDTKGEVLYALHGEVSPNAVPSTLVFDKQGRVAGRISGIADPSILRAMIERVLEE